MGNDPVNMVEPSGEASCERLGVDGSACAQTAWTGFGPHLLREQASEGTSGKGATAGAAVGTVLGVAGAMVCDGASWGLCVAGNPFIIGNSALAGAAIGDGIERAYNKLGALVDKATTEGPQETQYALTANYDGDYPNARGSTTWLNDGDVWKYGTTATPASRRTDSYLTDLGLTMEIQYRGTKYQTLAMEKVKLINYATPHRKLPPGNKIFR